MLNAPHLVVIPAFTYQKFADQIAADKSESGMVEALWLIDKDGWWALTGRYEIEHLPKTAASAEEDHTIEALNLAHFINRNARLAFEWSHVGDNIQGPRVNDFQLYAQVGY
jgi:hypothetical protein